LLTIPAERDLFGMATQLDGSDHTTEGLKPPG